MTKEQADQLIQYRIGLRNYIKQEFTERIIEGGEYGEQHLMELDYRMKRKIENEIMKVQAFLSGIVQLHGDWNHCLYTIKYHELP